MKTQPSNAVLAFLTARPDRPYHIGQIHTFLALNYDYDLSFNQVGNAAAGLARSEDIAVRRVRRGTYQYSMPEAAAEQDGWGADLAKRYPNAVKITSGDYEPAVVTAASPPLTGTAPNSGRLCVVAIDGKSVVGRFVGFVEE